MTLQLATLEGAEIAFAVEGGYDKPWLILSNSLATDHRMWAPQMDLLAERYRVVRYDARGHGQSSAPQAPYKFSDLAGDVIGLMNLLAIEQAAFVGLSLGGMTALALALDHADRISRIVCCDARADAPDGYKQMWPGNITRARDHGMDALVEPTLGRWFTDGFHAVAANKPVIDRTADMIRGTSVEGYAGCASALMELDFLPKLSGIGLPALYLVGEHDPAAPPDVMRDMADRTPGAMFAEIAGAAHLSNLEQPDRFNEMVLTWLDRSV